MDEIAGEVGLDAIEFRLRNVLKTCVYRKSDPAILVMKASQDRLGSDVADALDRAREG